ncbi:MAG: PEP-CTERM sorting domain-containing protein [Burkholderiales bacterium]
MSSFGSSRFAPLILSAWAGLGLLAATSPANALEDPVTLLRANNGLGGASMDQQAKVAQTYDKTGSVTGDFVYGPLVTGSDHLVASVDFRTMGFSYTQTVTNSYGRVGTPLANTQLFAREFFTVGSSALPLNAYIHFTLHATLGASFATTVDPVTGIVDFAGTALQARANGELLSVTAAQPFTELQVPFQVQVGGSGFIQGEMGLQMGANFRNQDARVTASYSIDALPADGKGLRMWITTDAPGTTLTFADGRSVVASVPEPETSALLLAGLGSFFLAGRRRFSPAKAR